MAEPTRRVRGAAAQQERIREQMQSYILEHGLHAGDPLPTETALMDLLDVSRHPLREAMKALQAVGIIEIRHGYGTYVGKVSLESLEIGLAFRMSQSMAGDHKDITNVLEVREALELGLAEQVVTQYATPASRDALADIVARMEAKAAAGEYFPDEDWSFHRALYEPLGNALIIDLLSVFWRTFSDVDARLPGPRYTPAEAVGWHRDLLEALVDGDPARFAQKMKDHFHGIHTRLGSSS